MEKEEKEHRFLEFVTKTKGLILAKNGKELDKWEAWIECPDALKIIRGESAVKVTGTHKR